MGDLISLSERRCTPAAEGRWTPRARGARATFYFDLALPATYLAAERVDRLFAGVRWQPVSGTALWGEGHAPRRDRLVDIAQQRATALGVPLVWPERFPLDARPIMRAAALACERGRGAPFVLAAGRLAFCGGFDLGDPETLIEAAAAAGLPLDDVLAAAGDTGRDDAIEEATARLRAAGVDALPAVRVGRRVYGGEERLGEALAASQAAEATRFAARGA